jgi:hypothetical protein
MAHSASRIRCGRFRESVSKIASAYERDHLWNLFTGGHPLSKRIVCRTTLVLGARHLPPEANSRCCLPVSTDRRHHRLGLKTRKTLHQVFEDSEYCVHCSAGESIFLELYRSIFPGLQRTPYRHGSPVGLNKSMIGAMASAMMLLDLLVSLDDSSRNNRTHSSV